MLEELEVKIDIIDTLSPDAALAFHKNILRQSKVIFGCAQCSSRSENKMLLAFVCEKLGTLCERIVMGHIYQKKRQQQQQQQQQQQRNFSTAQFQPESSQCNHNVTQHGAPSYLGYYAIDLPHELDCLIRVLITLQLRDLKALLTKMKVVATSGAPALRSMLLAAERKVDNVAMKLHTSV